MPNGAFSRVNFKFMKVKVFSTTKNAEFWHEIAIME